MPPSSTHISPPTSGSGTAFTPAARALSTGCSEAVSGPLSLLKIFCQRMNVATPLTKCGR